MKKNIYLITLISILIVVFGCSDNNSIPPVASTPPPDLIDVPEQIVIDETEITMSSYLWRDFMPTIPEYEDGQKLAAVIEMETVDNSDFPGGLIIEKLWLFNKDEVWETTFSESGQSNKTSRIIKSARGGPRWDIGSEVVVVVQIIDNDQIYYLKETGVEIYRTD
ncbi:MAG: hypothetical protein DWP97_01285 [Calditrichaeota bacterium]|nr:MAG: hypothetical protein DWP97_01285 [Calditrichota bacterium]